MAPDNPRAGNPVLSRHVLHPGLALRMAGKGLVRSPGTTLLAAAVLTLGLAAPTTFFSLLVGAIRPLPVYQGDRVVRVEVFQPTRSGQAVSVTLGDLRALRGAPSLEALGAFSLFQGTLLDPGAAAARVSGAALTPEVLPLLRVTPALGRIPGAGEEGETLLLGYDLWMEAYGGDPGVLGRIVTLNETSRAIVGVLPQGFGFPFHQNAWTLLGEGTQESEPVELVARLGRGASMTSAQAELAGLWARGDQFRTPDETGGRLKVDGFTGGRGEGGEGVAFLGLVLVALALLFIACSNVANLLLVRATERVRSLAVQSAVGASRIQIAAQLLLEAVLVSLLGGVGGVFLAWMAVSAIQNSLAAAHFGYFWMAMSIDGRVLAFVTFLVLGTALLAGFLPALRVMKTDLLGVMKEEGSGVTVGGGGAWSRGFVTAQLTLSCGALVAAGLTGVSLFQGSSFGEGLPAEETLLASLLLGDSAGEAVLAELEGVLAALPGVEGAALALGAPGFGERWGVPEIEGEVPVEGQSRRGVLWNGVTPSFFPLFDLQLRAGRVLSEGDGGGLARGAVVNQSFVRRFLPGRDPLGRRVRIEAADPSIWFTVVGVVEDLEVGGGPKQVRERIYLPLEGISSAEVLALVRGPENPENLVPGIRLAVAQVDPRIPLWSVRTLAGTYAYLTRVPRAMAAMALGGGLAGLLVAAVGLYGLLAFRVRQRRREMGLRLALGADGRRLAWGVLRLALRQLLPALVMGSALAWLLAPLIAVVLLGGDPRSPGVFLGVAGAFLLVGMLASVRPALRAASLEPARALQGK